MTEQEVKISRGAGYFREEFPFFTNKYNIVAGQTIERHAHDFVELVYVLEGGALHEMGGHLYTLRQGDLFVIEPGAAHSYKGAPDRRTVVYNVLFDRNLLYRELATMEDVVPMLEFLYLSPFLRKSSVFRPHLHVEGKQRLQLENHLETLLQETKRKEPGYQLVVKARMIECMVVLSRQCAPDAVTVAEPTDRQWMEAVVLLIKENFDKPLSLEQISRLCGMSVTSFSHKFKAHTGKTFLEFKHEAQIEAACGLLAQTDHKTIVIAHEVGFEDVSFFYRVFRKKTGTTPSGYRASLRAGSGAGR
ncbi:AraC family transcriptional regulator [Paenibacillus sp. GYB003]|uniref:AraC family transcriptional regulator n=1 Tax=Paenibacillus sp. GYB003 TaxID=2994392 RepID=UPI002F963BDD